MYDRFDDRSVEDELTETKTKLAAAEKKIEVLNALQSEWMIQFDERSTETRKANEAARGAGMLVGQVEVKLAMTLKLLEESNLQHSKLIQASEARVAELEDVIQEYRVYAKRWQDLDKERDAKLEAAEARNAKMISLLNGKHDGCNYFAAAFCNKCGWTLGKAFAERGAKL